MFQWLRKVPKQASRVAELGVPLGGDDAFKWYRKAAEKGTKWGQFNLAMQYARGEGVPQDHVEAMKWFQKAADQQDGMSQYCLGVMYEKGLGVPVDQRKAYQWFWAAASHGIHQAETACHRLRPYLTPEQMADSQPQPIPSASTNATVGSRPSERGLGHSAA